MKTRARIPALIAMAALLVLGVGLAVKKCNEREGQPCLDPQSRAPQKGNEEASAGRECVAKNAWLNEDSRKYLNASGSNAQTEGGEAMAPGEAPSFTGAGAAPLLSELNAHYGLKFEKVSEFAKRNYVAPLWQLDLFESPEQLLTGLSGDVVTQGDALLQIAIRVKLSGESRDTPSALAPFRNALEYLGEAKGSPCAQWVMEKARVALLEPRQPFVAKTTIDDMLVTLRYRPARDGFPGAALAADFEQIDYFRWLSSQLPQEAQRPSQERLK